MRRLIYGLVGIVASVVSAHAQTANPQRVVFTASTDHAAVVGSVAVLASYQLDVMTTAAGGALAFSVSLGKPDPAADGTITVPVAQLAALASGQYTATVSAVGPGGSNRSVPSDPFVRVAPPAVPGRPSVE